MGNDGVHGHQQGRHQQARNDAAEKEIANRRIGDEGIEHQGNGWRNDWADGGRGCHNGAGIARRIVAGLEHHPDRNLAHARGIGHGGARHAGKDQADQNIHLRHAALEAADNGLAEFEKPVADGADVHDVGRGDEQRHGQQDEAVIDALYELLRGERQVLSRQQEIGDG